ncbi:hypothetical protein ACIA8K_27790 [Catenuloplanes sp. NPDC051500]|uniref:hypothetical protein n=1 Tax=Catenuloplanes sp. NPDC051500 TaxID=3363959 RepID=UPI0037A629E7
MSFSLAVWRHLGVPTGEEAFDVYDRLSDGEVGVVEGGPKVSKFLNSLLEFYPDDNGLAAPWASEVYFNNECVLMQISWSRAQEVSAVVRVLAAENGLIVYDPQSREVLR